MIEIWPYVRKLVPQAKLVIAGDGDDRVRLETKARELSLGDSVRFLGRVSEDALRALYRDCTFFVMPSSGEGFGVVFLEAMRAGKACIGGHGASEEVIEDGVTGRIVSAADRRGLHATLHSFFSDPELRARMGEAGLDRFTNYFTETHFHQRFLAAINLAPQEREITAEVCGGYVP